jgi:hypothetical protein
MKKIILIALIVVIMSACLSAEDGNGGGPAAFLQLNLSARVMGMGGAYFGVSDDASAIFYNPAGLAQIQWNTVTASYRTMDFDRKLGFIGVGLQALEEARIGIGWIHASDGNIEGRDNEGMLTGEELSYNDNAIGITFAKKFGDKFMLGATGAYFVTKVANLTANTINFNLGAMAELDKLNFLGPESFFDVLRVGIVVNNLGGIYRWNTGDYYAPLGGIGVSQDENFRIGVKGGVSALMLDSTLLISADVAKSEEENMRFAAGGEYTLMDALALRAGYGNKRVAFGAGFFKTFVYYRLKFDYAFATGIDGEAGNHLFTVGFEFR